ncbi:hypothetical protein SAY87_008380 [Trapa incisa]|uniref:Uncharacterized protein n=1 Tax=Trapa incisa TaxID=236973 RepID=A0AAN7KD60_9MYRT|nr:hypothetical protein SAY87_008380 [Trapa incisa]
MLRGNRNSRWYRECGAGKSPPISHLCLYTHVAFSSPPNRRLSFRNGRHDDRRRRLVLHRDSPSGCQLRHRSGSGPVWVRDQEGSEEAEEDGREFRPTVVVSGGEGAGVARREPRRRLRVRSVRAREASGVPAVRAGLTGPEPGEERGRRHHRRPVRERRCEVHPVPALHGGVRTAAVQGVRAHPRALGHARHPRRSHRRVAHRRHLAGRWQGGACGRIVVPGTAVAVLDHDADMDRGVGDRVHRVPEERRARPGEETVSRRQVLRSAWASGRPGEEGYPPAGRDQTCPPRHGGFPRLCSPGGCHRQGPPQQLGHPLERPSPHHHHRHFQLLSPYCRCCDALCKDFEEYYAHT